MAVSQADFDLALAAYIADVDQGVQLLIAKAEQHAPEADFSSELAIIDGAKVSFDSALASLPQEAPPSEPQAPAEGPAVVSAVVGDPTGPNPPDSVEQAGLDAANATAAAQAAESAFVQNHQDALIEGGAVSPPAEEPAPADAPPALVPLEPADEPQGPQDTLTNPGGP